jgi:hypothetical protein
MAVHMQARRSGVSAIIGDGESAFHRPLLTLEILLASTTDSSFGVNL